MKKSVEYLDWHFTCDDGMADKDAQKAWFELREEFSKMDKKEIEVVRMLEEQEAVPAIQREVIHMLVWCCGSCGVPITHGDKFCRMCGKPVKWDG